ncbi:hypothetical protein [Edaphobacter aggregans]|uniref:hypothetical protein n=1 Tax=Edaphobacter aggregans TaxID=570835 RepID=UPI0012FC3EE6|nr:hypothetical protein [Edaphobacter aggregans]
MTVKPPGAPFMRFHRVIWTMARKRDPAQAHPFKPCEKPAAKRRYRSAPSSVEAPERSPKDEVTDLLAMFRIATSAPGNPQKTQQKPLSSQKSRISMKTSTFKVPINYPKLLE